jgi:SAM-dependent methyltransferase
MATYDVLAGHYDAVTGDSAPDATVIDGLIRQANANAVTLLELACGTGGIISALADRYLVSGLDISPGMLAVARKKLPAGTRLYEADMTCFELNAKFDAAICVYHSINHVLDFPGWERFFDRVHEHLNDGGVFVFDIDTLGNLKARARTEKYVQQFGDNYLLIRVRTNDGIIYDWNIEVFERKPGGDYQLFTQVLKTVSFPLERIRDALCRRFADVRTLDGGGAGGAEDCVDRIRDDRIREDRIWFVCAKAKSDSDRSSPHDRPPRLA